MATNPQAAQRGLDGVLVMASRPKVSVLILTYNQETYIAQAIESVVSQQTNFPIEIVIGEDCSTDGTRAIVQRHALSHPDRIRPLFRERNLGLMNNFTGTLGECRGEYIAVLGGDDYWIDNAKLQKQADLLDDQPDCSACFHAVRVVDEAFGNPEDTIPPYKPIWTIEDLINGCSIVACSNMFRREIAAALPAWYHKMEMEDWPLHFLNAERGVLRMLPDVMAVYRIHRKGYASQASRELQVRRVFKMFSAVDRHFDGRYSDQFDEARIAYLRDLARTADALRNSLSFRLGHAIMSPIGKFVAKMRGLRATNASLASDPASASTQARQ